ncbi:MAG TPA: hypothetical protein VGT41_04025 [Candidatus Babeliales bacterium]|nr:hypothetical protein [Candidatus Babeliales bacterium]
MNKIVKNILVSLLLSVAPLQSGVCAAQTSAVGHEAEYQRALEQMKKAYARVDELYDAQKESQQKQKNAMLELRKGMVIAELANVIYRKAVDRLTKTVYGPDEMAPVDQELDRAYEQAVKVHARIGRLYEQAQNLQEEQNLLLQYIKQAEVMVELTTKIFDRAAVGIADLIKQ